MLNKIKEDVKKVIAFSQGYDIALEDMNIDPLIDQWLEAKRDFIECFGGYIFEYPGITTFELDEKSKKSKYHEFIEYALRYVSPLKYENLEAYLMQCSYQEFYQNKLDKDFIRQNIEIKAGTKFLKGLKYFFPDAPNALDRVQTEASRVLQEIKVSGILCVSVHPLDFLSSSENSCNWRSCHSLDGDFRAGNLAYMVDKSTVICYLKSPNGDGVINNFPIDVPWNNKKWRCLLFWDSKWRTVFAGRQYPFSANTALPLIRDRLFMPCFQRRADMFSFWEDAHLSEFNGEQLRGRYYCIRNEIFDINKMIKENNGLFFNDLVSASSFVPFYSYDRYHRPPSWEERQPYFDIGGDPYCPICGQEHIRQSEFMLCDSCLSSYEEHYDDDGFYCEECGCWVHEDDVVIVEGSYICPSCVEGETSICSICGERVWNEHGEYNPKTEEFICSCHLNRREN